MQIVHGVWEGVDTAFFMFWATLWALVLGFALSGAVQAFVSRTQMQQALGDHRPKTLAKSSFFGAVSSSCSYASSALAKSLFARGADFTASIVFMVASTNLVLELGIVLWLLIGWQFALAEFVGGAIMIMLLGLVVPRVIPAGWLQQARERLDDSAPDDDAAGQQDEPLSKRLRSRRGWGDASGYTISDLSMLRKELFIGFVVAGFLAALVPTWFWRSIFLTGHGFWSSLENVIIGPFLALISFVCSVGNVPLAAALWEGGISFGGVVSFVFADLITLPLLAIYRKYYGTRIMLRLLGVMWATMSVGGLAVEYLFRLVRIPAPGRPTMVVHTGFEWNYTTFLNIVALIGFAVLYWLYKHRDTSGGRYAKDPVCGMQVEIANAPARRSSPTGEGVYFCSDHCAQRYDTTGAGNGGHGTTDKETGDSGLFAEDPMCGMRVEIADAAAERTDASGAAVYFCSEHCAQQYEETNRAGSTSNTSQGSR
ncbi:permease [Dermatophilaceae bacterium Sec6.4]